MSWLIKLAAYFCQSLIMPGRVYCQMTKVDWLTACVLLRELAHCPQILPANEKLGLEADEITQTLLTNRMQRKLQDQMAERRKLFARIAWLAASALQTWVGLTLDSCKQQPAYRRPNTEFFTVCKPYANLKLTLTNQAPL